MILLGNGLVKEKAVYYNGKVVKVARVLSSCFEEG